MTIPKYRAWHKQRQIMLPVLQIDLDPEHGGVFVESNDGSHCGCRYHMELWPWSDIELMQFTNCQDEHKTEIYQGDIIQIMNCWSEKHHAYVAWEKAQPMYIWMIGETWMLHFINGPAKDEPAPLYPYCQPQSGLEITVIGNIWQDGKLIDQYWDHKTKPTN